MRAHFGMKELTARTKRNTRLCIRCSQGAKDKLGAVRRSHCLQHGVPGAHCEQREGRFCSDGCPPTRPPPPTSRGRPDLLEPDPFNNLFDSQDFPKKRFLPLTNSPSHQSGISHCCVPRRDCRWEPPSPLRPAFLSGIFGGEQGCLALSQERTCSSP